MLRKTLNPLLYLLLFTFLNLRVGAQNQIPLISNITVAVDSALNQIQVGYDLTDVESDPVEVSVTLSDDLGVTFLASINVSGDVGYPVTPGSSKNVTIQYTPSSVDVKSFLIKLVADDLKEIDIQTVVNQIDSNNLKNDLSFVEGIRHYIAGTTHLEEVKDTIESRFQQKGLQTSRQEVVKGGYTGHNIIGRLPGQENESKTYIIDGHFDTVNSSPGADDNGSAVVGMLEAMRILSQYNFKHSIRFIGFDFEETLGTAGLAGSLEYAQNGIEDYENIEGVVNFEMIGYYSNEDSSQDVPNGFEFVFQDQLAALAADNYRGNFITLVTNSNSLDLSDAFASLSSEYVPELKIMSFTGDGILDLQRSDHFSFWLNNIPAIMLTDGAEFRNHNYHSPNDKSDVLNFTFMSQVVKAAVATLANLAGIQHSSYKVVNMSGEVIKEMTSPVGIAEPDCDFGFFHLTDANQLVVNPGTCFQKSLRITVYSMEGKLLDKIEINNQSNIRIATSAYTPGLYIAAIDDGHTRISRQFFVK